MRASLAAFTSEPVACAQIRWVELWRITCRDTRCVSKATTETTKETRPRGSARVGEVGRTTCTGILPMPGPNVVDILHLRALPWVSTSPVPTNVLLNNTSTRGHQCIEKRSRHET